MPIQVPITRKEIKDIERALRGKADILCLDANSHLKTILVAQQMLFRGKDPVAKIVKFYDDPKSASAVSMPEGK